jgi:hypothetical protein
MVHHRRPVSLGYGFDLMMGFLSMIMRYPQCAGLEAQSGKESPLIIGLRPAHGRQPLWTAMLDGPEANLSLHSSAWLSTKSNAISITHVQRHEGRDQIAWARWPMSTQPPSSSTSPRMLPGP